MKISDSRKRIRNGRGGRLAGALALLLAAAPWAWGHGMDLFATVMDDQISGSASYEDGAPVVGATVRLLAPDGRVLDEGETDPNGAFSFRAWVRCETRIQIETADGHGVRYTIDAEELPATLPWLTGPGTDQSPTTPTVADPTESLDNLSRQMVALRKQIDALEKQTRFQDVIGALGYLLGLTGLLALWKSRSRKG